MDTGILHLTGRSCHDNKSQRADPFIVLSRIIAGKTKCVKDPFPAQIHAEARQGKGCRRYNGFWENWGNARTNRGGENRDVDRERKGTLREFWSAASVNFPYTAQYFIATGLQSTV